MSTILRVQGYPIALDKDDYICLTDMAKVDGDDSRSADVIKNWIRTRTTIEFLGTWEAINNPTVFNVVEFDHFRKSSGLPTFTMSVSNWVEKTGAIGLYTKQGKYGGTYAHKDIAFEFGSAISPAFKLYLIKEFQRLKEIESNSNNIEWNVRRVLSKSQYHIQTDAIKNYKLPRLNLPIDKHFVAYAEEGDILNLALFGFTAKMWRESNPELAGKNQNVREYASINELSILSSLEGINAEMIKENIPFNDRLKKLSTIASEQLKVLERISPQNNLRKNSEGELIDRGSKKEMFPQKKNELSDFNKKLKTALEYKPKKDAGNDAPPATLFE